MRTELQTCARNCFQAHGGGVKEPLLIRAHPPKAMAVTLLVLLAAAAVLAPAFQSTHPLTGRHIANVMGFRGADWLERPERESEENVEGALDAIELKPGMTVAEVGAGTGYVSLRMAKRAVNVTQDIQGFHTSLQAVFDMHWVCHANTFAIRGHQIGYRPTR